MSYFPEWIGAVVPVARVVFLVAPWLSLIALIAVLMFAVPALVALRRRSSRRPTCSPATSIACG
jgi:predicted membrane metal-binding protein